jgi:KDO2-lipid IV(A) lauroyltransferase
MYVSKPIKLDKSKTINQITLYLNNILEKMILKNVDQWIWSHDRWKE